MPWNRLAQLRTHKHAVCRPHWNELYAAANERNAETLKATALPEITTNVPRVGQITALRARIEALIPYFYDGETGNRWTKETCLTAAIGKPDWTSPVITHKTVIRAPHINDPRQVLDKLCWVRRDYPSIAEASPQTKRGSSSSWASAKSAYESAPWGALVGSGRIFSAYWAAPSTFVIENNRARSAAIQMPSFSILAARVVCSGYIYGSASGVIRLHEEADFNGASHDFAISGVSLQVADVATPGPGDLLHYSWRANPELPNPDDYQPLAPDTENSFSCGFYVLAKLGFNYLT
ncbi:MAG TPA: hypothetical protein PK280_14025 [Planctomycetota bacterium]|nr:hypothetical protein [Planctomycetota bacterium]